MNKFQIDLKETFLKDLQLEFPLMVDRHVHTYPLEEVGPGGGV